MAQPHKKFTDSQIKELLERYVRNEIERKYVQQILGIKDRRFFILIKQLSIEKELIGDENVPIKSYNYSYIKDLLVKKYNQTVSLPTIIDRAKKNGFYLKKRPKRTVHDREVLTNYIGEMIQHDSSYHLWSPPAKEKWYLVTSLDDFSRFILYAIFLKKETSWAHILGLETVILSYGVPFSYYVDCHSIFRFVQGRDSFWRRHHKLTDEASPQWKQVLDDCNVKIIYALSPQAKGKVERPYGWLQDRVIRTCVRER